MNWFKTSPTSLISARGFVSLFLISWLVMYFKRPARLDTFTTLSVNLNWKILKKGYNNKSTHENNTGHVVSRAERAHRKQLRFQNNLWLHWLAPVLEMACRRLPIVKPYGHLLSFESFVWLFTYFESNCSVVDEYVQTAIFFLDMIRKTLYAFNAVDVKLMEFWA